MKNADFQRYGNQIADELNTAVHRVTDAQQRKTPTQYARDLRDHGAVRGVGHVLVPKNEYDDAVREPLYRDQSLREDHAEEQKPDNSARTVQGRPLFLGRGIIRTTRRGAYLQPPSSGTGAGVIRSRPSEPEPQIPNGDAYFEYMIRTAQLRPARQIRCLT